MGEFARVLHGRNVRLEALASEHVEGLCQALMNESEGWFALQYGLTSAGILRERLLGRIKANDNRTSFSYVTVDLKSSRVAGISHFMKIDMQNRQAEIGGTQVGKDFRRGHVNTETKLLMLTEAFEKLRMVRVYFKVDVENLISRKSISRMGAQLEGTFRNEWILPDGRVRDCHIYSITNQDWPSVKTRLEGLAKDAV